MTERQKAQLEEARKELAIRNPWAIRTRAIIEAGLQFHENIWSDDKEFWKAAKKDPLKFKSRFASFAQFFGKLQPPRDPETGERKRWSADQLEQEGHSEEEIEKLAFGNNGNDSIDNK